MASSSPPPPRRHSRPPSASPPPRSPPRSPSPILAPDAPQDHLSTHLDWISTKLHLSDTCRDTGDPLRLQVVTPLPSPAALADTHHDDVRTLHANADVVLRAFRKWLAPDGDAAGTGDADVSVNDMSHWPVGGGGQSTAAGDQRQASASTRLRKRVIPPFAAAVAAMEYDDGDETDLPSTGMSANLRVLLVSLDQVASPGVTCAVQLALAVAFIIKHDSQPEFTIPGEELVGWIRALLFDFDSQATVVEEQEEQVVRSVRAVSTFAVRVAIMLLSLAVHTGAEVDDLDSEFGEALDSMCLEWGSVVERLRNLPTIDQGSHIRLPTTVATALRYVIAEQILHMDLSGGIQTSHTSTTSTPSHASSPHPLTISTSRAPGAAPAPTSRPETATTTSSGETTPKALTQPHALADDEDDGEDGNDNESHPDPGTLPLSDLPTQQLQDMRTTIEAGWILGPGESQFARYADVRTYMPTMVHGSDSEDAAAEAGEDEDEDEDEESEREPDVLADVDALMDQRGTEDEDGDEEAEHAQSMRDMSGMLHVGVAMGMDMEARDEDAMDEDDDEDEESLIVLTATRPPKRVRQDSAESNLEPDQPRPDLSNGDDDKHDDDEHDDGDIDLGRPLHKRRKVGDSPRFQISEQTTNRRANGGRLIDTQPSPSHRSRPSVQPPSFDDLTVRGDSTTGQLATPPIPSPARSRQRAAAAAADRMDTERNDDDNRECESDEQQPAQVQNLARRPPWNRPPPPRKPGARIASTAISDTDADPPAPPRPGSPTTQPGPRRMPGLRDPPPHPQPPLFPLPEPEPERQPQPGPGAGAAPARLFAPAAGARARARRPRTSWTVEEEVALERAMEEFEDSPPSWAEILRRHGQPGGPLARFDQVQLKDKARNIKTKRRKYGEPLGVFEWATDYPSGL